MAAYAGRHQDGRGAWPKGLRFSSLGLLWNVGRSDEGLLRGWATTAPSLADIPDGPFAALDPPATAEATWASAVSALSAPTPLASPLAVATAITEMAARATDT